MIIGERGTVALRHEARCTRQCCPGLLSARPMGGRCLCCCGMPHGCDWPAPRRVSSARRSDSGQRNSPGLNAQPGAPARAGASHGADKASECSPRLAQMRPSSQPTVHRLLQKHCDECGTGDAWQAGHDAVIKKRYSYRFAPLRDWRQNPPVHRRDGTASRPRLPCLRRIACPDNGDT